MTFPNEVPPQPSSEATPASSENAGVESPFKSTGGTRRIYNAMRYSLRGLAFAWQVESAFRQELTLALVLTPIALVLPLPVMQRLALIASVVLVLIVELINSSIESAVDRISLDPHRLSGRAKDFGSAAVFLALMLCALAWVLIAGPVIWRLALG